MGEKVMKGKAITKVLSCLVVIVFLMSTFSVAVIATNSANSTASNVNLNLNLNDNANSSVESVALSNNITGLTCRDDLIQININKTETVVNESVNSDLSDASNTSSPDIINESDEVPDPDLPVINDTDVDTAKTVSSMSSCSYVWIKVTDKYCYGYKVYVDGVYQFTEGESGTPDGYCCFKVTPGYHTFKLTLNGKEVSKGWNCQCGHVYNWVSMNNMIPHWCERPDQCKNPPTVSFDKSKYYEGDTVHATISTIYGVYYKIMDCSGTVRDSGYASNGDTIYYTIPSGASECCYWKICFYWDEGTPPLGLAGYEGDITTASYECTKCYSFYVCPHETSCKVWINVEDNYCKGYGVYVDGVYQFTEGESGTPDGYCRFYVTPGTHKFELRKNGCSVSKSWYCQCGTSYRWISMNDMYPHWCDCNKKPDLVVQDISWSPSNPKQGDTVTINVKTKNQGSGSAGGFYVGYYVDGSYYTRDYVSSLSAGSTTTTSFTWTADCGSHAIKAVADCYDAITESNEGNNDRTEYINIVCKPDLVIQDISWSPSNPKKGDTVTINVKTKNKGSENAGGFYVGYYVDSSYYTRDYVSSLSAGSTTTTSFTWTADCGSHSIKAVADYSDAVEESNEENNYKTESFTIPCPKKKPDLTIQGYYLNACVSPSEKFIDFDVTVENIGEGTAKESTTYIYLGNPEKQTTFFLYHFPCPSLKPGGTHTYRMEHITLENCGKCEFVATADVNHEVDESNEGNNSKVIPFEIPCPEEEKPDLTIQSVLVSPSNPKEGDTVTFTVKTKNQGSGNAGGFYVCYYVDGSYYDRDYVSSLSDGSTTTTSFTWTAECGNHAIKAVADYYSDVEESNEGNNEREEAASVSCEKPDLVIEDISWIPENPTEKDWINFSVKIKNQGLRSAGSSTVKLCILLDEGSSSLSRPVPPLVAGEGYSFTTGKYKLTCGNYTLQAIVDPDEGIDESFENNNQRTETLTIKCLAVEKIWITGLDKIGVGKMYQWTAYGACPDGYQKILTYQVSWTATPSDVLQNIGYGKFKGLKDGKATIKITYQGKSATKIVTVSEKIGNPDIIIQDIWWSPPNPKKGDNITFFVKAKNQGQGPSTDTDLTGHIITETGQYLLSFSTKVPPLAAGGEYTYKYILGKVTECGVIKAEVGVDTNKIIEESNENNNERSEILEIPCKIEKPDLTVTDFTWSPEHLKIGDTIKITFCITNEGKGVATENQASFVIANTSTKEILVNKTINLMDLNPKFGYCGGVNCIVKKCGTFSVIVSATTAHDSNLQNNTLAKKLEIECIREKPDLVIQDITWEPENPKLGDEVEFAVTVKNIGKETAGKSHVFVYAINWDAGKVLFKIKDACPSLKPGEVYTYHKNVKIEDCGESDLMAWADARNEVTESNEKNNYKGASFTVPCPKEKPDLTISSISMDPKNPKVGDEVTFKATVKNQGSGNTKTTFFVIGTLYEPTQFGPSPSSLWSRAVFPFPAGEEYAFSATRKLTACGNYRFRAEADSTFNIDESNEGNNYRDIDFTVPCPEGKPDLIIQDISWDKDSPKQGDRGIIVVIIENCGPGDAGAFGVKLDDGNHKTSLSVPSLAAHSTAGYGFYWTADRCEGVQMKITADMNNVIDESNEDNNEKTKTLPIRCPDLKVESVTYSPKKVLQGTMITVTAKVKNIGDADAGESNTYIEFTDSAGQSKGGEVVKIGALSVGEETTIEKNYLMQQTGKRILSVEANYDKAVKESDYSNNKKKVTIEVIGISISVKVDNVNNGELWWDGKINVRAYDENNKRVDANAEKSFNNVDSVTVSLQVPSDASLIRVFQTPKIKDGVQEYWGSMAIQPTGQTTYEFTRHTSWISGDITINGHSIYSDTINLNKKGIYDIAIPVTNSGYSESSVIVEVLLDRDEKPPWDFRTDYLISINSKEEKDFHFTYEKDKETTGIWRFRAIVKEQYESEGGAIANTDQHAWYMVLGEKPIGREISLGVLCTYYSGVIGQEPEDVFNEGMRKAWAVYGEEIGEITTDAILYYDPILGALVKTSQDPFRKGIDALINFANSARNAWNDEWVAYAIKKCGVGQRLKNFGDTTQIETRVECWKSRDVEEIGKQLINEGKMFAYFEGFSGEALNSRFVSGKTKEKMEEFHEFAKKEYDYTGQMYYDLKEYGEFDRNKAAFNDLTREGRGYGKQCAKKHLR